MAQGLAVCAPQDNFSRATSRKLSFEKALGVRSLRQEGLLAKLTAAFATFGGNKRGPKTAKPQVHWNRETRTLVVLHA
jgi:hypothetical protein